MVQVAEPIPVPLMVCSGNLKPGVVITKRNAWGWGRLENQPESWEKPVLASARTRPPSCAQDKLGCEGRSVEPSPKTPWTQAGVPGGTPCPGIPGGVCGDLTGLILFISR